MVRLSKTSVHCCTVIKQRGIATISGSAVTVAQANLTTPHAAPVLNPVQSQDGMLQAMLSQLTSGRGSKLSHGMLSNSDTKDAGAAAMPQRLPHAEQ